MNSWSYSHYSAAMRCLRYYQHSIVLGTPTTEPESPDLAFGSALHSALNATLHGEDGERVFELYWKSYYDKPLAYDRFDWNYLYGLGLSFISKWTRTYASKYKVVQTEQRLFATYKGIKLEGTPDFVGLYEDIPSVRDFKTSAYNYSKDKTAIALQLYLYAYLSIQNGVLSPKTLGYDVFTKSTGVVQKPITWDFKHEDMIKALDNMVSYVELLRKQEGYPQNYNSCLMGKNRCQFFEECHGKKNS